MDKFTLGGQPRIAEISPKFRDMVRVSGFDLSLLFGCKIKILMVTDGSHYDDGNGYHLSEVIKAITSDLPNYLTIDITTADHHSGATASGADINDINLSNHNLNQYDQIWFVAVYRNGSPGMDDDEVEAVWNFMQAGGGVFATGDHEDLGAALCGKIPRVRSMRRWWDDGEGPQGEPDAPSASGADRHTTTIGSDFDGTPQTIIPKKYSSWYSYLFGTYKFPHPVLCGPEGEITVLPDHMHEGLIEVPSLTQAFTVNGSGVTEYPKRGSTKLAPEVIATATNHVTGQPFGVIGAYDGHQVTEVSGGVGRIVVDATWHHFYNTNLNQFRYGFEAAETAIANGMAPNPADETLAMYYRQMRAYFQNIAVWLAKKGTQSCIRRRGLWFIRWHLDLQMAVLPSRRIRKLDYRVRYYFDLGTKAKDAFQRLAPQCQTFEAFTWVFERLPLYKMINPWVRDPELEEKFLKEMELPKTFDPEVAMRVMMGGAIHAVAEQFGKEMDDKRIDSGELDEVVQKGAMEALQSVLETMGHDREGLERLIKG